MRGIRDDAKTPPRLSSAPTNEISQTAAIIFALVLLEKKMTDFEVQLLYIFYIKKKIYVDSSFN